jgi:hypothetical protein
MEFLKAILCSLPSLLPFPVFASDSSSPTSAPCSNRWVAIDANAEAAGLPTKRFCRSASWAIDQMDDCGLAIQQKLTVEVVEELRHPCGVPVMGMFDATGFRVRLASPSQCRRLASQEAALAGVSFDALYDSIVVHEVIHAVLWKQLEHQESENFPAIATEYVAYAFQLSSLPKADLDTLLAAFPRAPPRDLGPFNSTALLLNPIRFATNAYRHFMSVEDRCDYLRGVISGEVQFDDWDQYE